MTPAKKERLRGRMLAVSEFILRARQAINPYAKAAAIDSAVSEMAVVLSALVEEVEEKNG